MDDQEQRRSARYEAGGVKVFIGWHGSHGFNTIPGEILNLSLGGAAIAVAGLPQGLRSAWIRPAGNQHDQVEWMNASIVEVSEEFGGNQRMRMRFVDGCPYDLFKTIVFAATEDDGTPADRRPAVVAPSLARTASPPLAVERPPATSTVYRQPEPACVPENSPVPANHLRAAFQARGSDRFQNFRSPSTLVGR